MDRLEAGSEGLSNKEAFKKDGTFPTTKLGNNIITIYIYIYIYYKYTTKTNMSQTHKHTKTLTLLLLL